jgi:RNA polymerase sigma-70 factor (ECF subfamily)
LDPWPSSPADPALGADPADRYQQRENVELAFVAALQRLPASQRAVLILREVLELPAAEVAEALDTTVAAVNSSLQRARRTLDRRIVAGTQAAELRALGERGRDDLVTAFVAAWERADVDAVLALLAEDARFAMPPFPAWFSGRAAIARFLSERAFQYRWRIRPLVANGQLAMAFYRRDPGPGPFTLGAVTVFTLEAGQVAAMHAFLDPATHRWFDLPDERLEDHEDGNSAEPR